MDDITGTPFKWVKQDYKYFIAFAGYKITEPTNTLPETLEKLQTQMYNLIFHMVIIIAHTVIDENKKPETERYKIPDDSQTGEPAISTFLPDDAEPMNYQTDPQHG